MMLSLNLFVSGIRKIVMRHSIKSTSSPIQSFWVSSAITYLIMWSVDLNAVFDKELDARLSFWLKGKELLYYF